MSTRFGLNQVNKTFFEISNKKKDQAIKDAEKTWDRIMSTSYGLDIKISLEEFNKQTKETPFVNKAFFKITQEKQDQAIKNAQRRWGRISKMSQNNTF